MDYITILSVLVGGLAALVTMLVGWNIYQMVSLEKMVEKRVWAKLAEYDRIADDRLAKQKVELLKYLVIITHDSGQLDATLYILAKLPYELERAKMLSDNSIKKLSDGITQIIQNADVSEYALPARLVKELIESLAPYSRYEDARSVLDELHQVLSTVVHRGTQTSSH